MTSKLQDKDRRIKQFQKEVLEDYYGMKFENLDITGGRASLEVHSDIQRREMTIGQWVKDEMDDDIFACARDQSNGCETQRFVIHSIMTTDAALADMIMGNKEMAMNELSSTILAPRTVAGEAQLWREVAIFPKYVMECQ
ncbi:MAG: hypothetical protein EZS28_001067 [Streblomastix strix]|uniref:Uncharacterized protein n=1 Tax=Streblomastix strix TaxID=222440 RepID=A0A5J4XA39_9EUKA|nr:MAG: hypothetical protein EZS28_001067 [Streblomastix strix]